MDGLYSSLLADVFAGNIDADKIELDTAKYFSTEELNTFGINTNYGSECTSENLLAISNARMAAMDKSSDATKLHVCTNQGIHFRIFFSPSNYIESGAYQNKFNTFLMQLNENQSVTLVLGSAIGNWWILFSLGSLVHSLRTAKCKIITSAVGRCSPAESVLWAFGQERKMSRYADLNLVGVAQMLKYQPAYKEYFKFIYTRFVDIGLIDTTVVDKLLSTNTSLFYTGYK